jgi:integrase
MKRFKTDYPGVFFRKAARIGGAGLEKVFYIVFKKAGKVYEEKVGRQYADDMTPARAARIRADRIEGRRESRKEMREEQKAIKERWTIEKLWTSYKENHPGLKGLAQDECRFKKHIEPTLGKKEPSELVSLDADRIRIKLLKTMKPATVRNVLELLRRIISYAAKKQLCKTPGFIIEMPEVNNLKTEDLNEVQMARLLRILREGVITTKDGSQKMLDRDARDAMLMALCTGMRSGEIFKLQWDDIDFRRGFISIKDPKGGPDQTIPLSEAARDILEKRPRVKNSPYVFPSCRIQKEDDAKKPWSHRVDAAKQFREIRDAAGLPKDFRPMHGLRHTFASHLASSGEVDLYTIQRLLTHKSPAMTQRYAHLRDDTLRSASNLVGNIIKNSAKENEPEIKDISV